MQFYFYYCTWVVRGGGRRGKGWGVGGRKRKWLENVNSALFMDPVEKRGQRLGLLP